ncbi:uncharacterized mitochondrial protein-like protein [Tanacetum coccineum]
MWEAIKTHNLWADRRKEPRLHTIITEFKNLKMSDNDTINAYAAKLSGIASKSATLGEVMSEHKLVNKFLTSLPRCFVHIVASLEQVLDLKTKGLNIPMGIMNQVEEEDVAHTLEVVNEVEIKDVVRTTLKTKAAYRKVPNREIIIVAVYGDDLFVIGTSLDLINKFKKRMASQFEMSDLGESTYYLCIEVSQGKDYVEIKQERYARKILKEAGIEDCFATLCPMEPGLKLSKTQDEQEAEATQYQKIMGCLRYLLHTRPDLAYSVGMVSRYMQSLRVSHARAIKQILRYLKCTTSFGIKYNHSNDMKLVGYSDSSHNVDIDDGQSTTRNVFYLATAAACQAIWLREVLMEVTENEQVQGDGIVTWCARVILFDSEIHGVIVGVCLRFGYGSNACSR